MNNKVVGKQMSVFDFSYVYQINPLFKPNFTKI